MSSAIEILTPLLSEGEASKKGTVIIGTVKGDLHDIGKNLVSCTGVLLSNMVELLLLTSRLVYIRLTVVNIRRFIKTVLMSCFVVALD
jgi:hypothetical protein